MLTLLIGGTIGFAPNAKAASHVIEITPVKELAEDNITTLVPQPTVIEKVGKSPTFETNGVKSKAVLKVAELLLEGGDKVTDALEFMNVIDSSVAKSIKANNVKLGNKIKTFANYGEDAANAVRNQLPRWITDNTNISKGAAENISIGLSYAIRGADWLFF